MLEVGDGNGREDAADELVEDDAVDGFAVGGVGAEVVEAAGGEFFGVDFALDEVAGAGEAYAMEAALDRLFGYDFGDVEPGEGAFGEDVGKRLMDGVVGADEEVGADAGEFVGRGEHEAGDGGPVVAVDVVHVLGEWAGVGGDLGVVVRAEELRAFEADGSVAEGRAFGGAGDDADVLGHDVF